VIKKTVGRGRFDIVLTARPLPFYYLTLEVVGHGVLRCGHFFDPALLRLAEIGVELTYVAAQAGPCT
jgi:hypothetical protein